MIRCTWSEEDLQVTRFLLQTDLVNNQVVKEDCIRSTNVLSIKIQTSYLRVPSSGNREKALEIVKARLPLNPSSRHCLQTFNSTGLFFTEISLFFFILFSGFFCLFFLLFNKKFKKKKKTDSGRGNLSQPCGRHAVVEPIFRNWTSERWIWAERIKYEKYVMAS